MAMMLLFCFIFILFILFLFSCSLRRCIAFYYYFLLLSSFKVFYLSFLFLKKYVCSVLNCVNLGELGESETSLIIKGLFKIRRLVVQVNH